MDTLKIKSNVFLSLIVLMLVSSASICNALTINSTDFRFTAGNAYPIANTNFDTGDNYEYDFATDTGANEVGIFSFNDEDILEVINGNYYAVSATLTFTMFDGDTALYDDGSDDIDYDDLVLTLGNASDTVTFEQFYLNGFPHEDTAAVSYDYEINDYNLAVSLADLVINSDGEIIFYINDTDEGGNKLFFDETWNENFSLSVTFETVPVPEPGTLFLISSGILSLIGFRKRIIKRNL